VASPLGGERAGHAHEPRLRGGVGDLARESASAEADDSSTTRSLADAQRSRKMTIEGDKTAVERLIRLFPTPEPAAAVTPA
jgi:hypothetical protein